MKVTTLPYIPPRKPRRQENLRFIVKWIEGSTMHFQAFKRDAAACRMVQQLQDNGINARVIMGE